MEIKNNKLIMDKSANALGALTQRLGRALLFSITAIPTLAIIFIIFFITREALPFFSDLKNVAEFFTGTNWRPSNDADPHFGALPIFYGTVMVTVGSCIVAVPLGILTAVCLSEIVSKKISRIFKPVVELLAAIPSVAFGFFALIVFAPLLQNHGGIVLFGAALACGIPLSLIISLPLGEWVSIKILKLKDESAHPWVCAAIFVPGCSLVCAAAAALLNVEISSGTNALNASVILAIMALPTIVSISQDAINSVGRDMREGSLALGATRFETIFKVVLPCAKSGIAVAVILGLMRVVGETMVVWMASGNSLKIPEPFYNVLEPVRTMTATIAGEMGEADQSTGSARYHVLFAMSFCLLVGGLILNAASQWVASDRLKAKKI